MYVVDTPQFFRPEQQAVDTVHKFRNRTYISTWDVSNAVFNADTRSVDHIEWISTLEVETGNRVCLQTVCGMVAYMDQRYAAGEAVVWVYRAPKENLSPELNRLLDRLYKEFEGRVKGLMIHPQTIADTCKTLALVEVDLYAGTDEPEAGIAVDIYEGDDDPN